MSTSSTDSRATTVGTPGMVDLRELLAILNRRRWVILSTVMLITTLAALIGAQITPTYTARAVLMIDPKQAKVIDTEQVAQGLGSDMATVETQLRLIRSRENLQRVVEDMRLYNDPEFNPLMRAGPIRQVELTVQGPWQSLFAWLPESWLIATGLAEEPVEMTDEDAVLLAQETAITRVEKQLDVTQEGRSYVLAVRFTSENPQKAAAIANKVVQTFVDEQLAAKEAVTIKASDWLGDKLEQLKREVERSERAVEDFRFANNLLDTEKGPLNDQQLANINQQIIDARAYLSGIQAKLDQIKQMRKSGEGIDSLSEVLSSAVIINLRALETDLLRQEADLRATYGAKHPRVQTLRSERKGVADKIQAEIDRIAKSLQSDAGAQAKRIASLEQSLNETKANTAADRTAEVKLRELEREAMANRTLYEQFLARYKETREQEEIVEPDARVISIASAPKEPSSPGPKLFAAVGFGASLMLGTLLALFLERLDVGLRSQGQVERALGIPAIGLVPRLDRLRGGTKPHRYLVEKPLSAYAESIRSIYTALQLADVDSPPKVVMVTSSLPQEGKTTLSLSLATFAARSAQRVLLMDLDLRHPSVQRDTALEVRTGLIELMSGEVTLDEALHRDEPTNLDILPVKRQTGNPTDILSSQRMRALIAELRQRYDYIVIDSAPLLGVTDSRIAALFADRVLLAIRWQETTRETAQGGLRQLQDVRAPIAGAVLTQVDVRKHAQYGYGDVGQYYGKYSKYYVN